MPPASGRRPMCPAHRVAYRRWHRGGRGNGQRPAFPAVIPEANLMAEPRNGVNLPSSVGLGRRIMVARTERGMSRETVAALCGRSEEWLRQIERGKRGTGLHMLAKLAEVLRVKNLADLIGEHAPTAVFVRPEHQALGDVRSAVVTFGPTDTQAGPGLTDVRERVKAAWLRRSLSHRDRTDLAAVLPGLIGDAQAVSRDAATPSQQRDANTLLAEVYHLGQLYLCYQDASELLWVVVDRAMSAALASEDPAAIGRAAWFS